ncbi:MAG TPA: hypothetical protein VNT81_19205 [Vicinamibacterales bacterium]|nr:hypothetical protein [Vicinamibacterales bacterium]
MRAFVLAVAIAVFTAVPSFAQSDETVQTLLSSVDTLTMEEQSADVTQPQHKPMSKWWAVAVAAGPLFDGATTWWAMRQSGPAMTIREGNGFYQKLFGQDAKGWEIMAFKTGQAAILAFGMHEIGKKKEGVERVIYSVVLNSVVSGVASTINIRRGMQARRLNAAYAVQW